MSASSSLSRLEFVLHSVEASDQKFNASLNGNGSGGSNSSGNGSGKGLGGYVPSWLGGGSTSGGAAKEREMLPMPAGAASSAPLPAASSPSGSSAATAKQLASSAAASASAAASKVSSKTSEWFGVLSSKVTGKEYAPPAAAQPASATDLEEGSKLLPAADASSGSGSSGNAASALAAQFSSEWTALTTLSWKNRMLACVFCALAGCTMLGLAFMHLSLVFLGSPAKFALSYALAQVFLILSSCFLVGPTKQLSQMFAPGRVWISVGYVASLLLLFYCSWQIRNVFIVLPVLLVQLVSLTAYIMSFIPFGQTALKRMCSWTLGRQLAALTAA